MLEICFIGLSFSVLMIFKNNNTYRNRIIIGDAIRQYNVNRIERGEYHLIMSYDIKKSYEKSLFSLFDWGYKNIIPPEEFELIKPFIDEDSYKKY